VRGSRRSCAAGGHSNGDRMRILSVEPDPAVATSIELMLEAQGFCVYTTNSGEEAVDLAKLYDYDAITMELALPDMSGFDVIRQLSIAKCKTPIIVVSNHKRVQDVVMALGIGAADHLPKPFHADELVARILALVRRCNGYVESQIDIGPLRLNLYLRTIHVVSGRLLRQVPLQLTRKEYGILEILMLRAGRTLSKGDLLNHLYGGMDEPELKIVDVMICKLRKKLDAAGAPDFIKTVWGRGVTVNPQVPTLKECLANAS
jgi:two-component system, cell cycle response regulator CtrA